MPFVSRSLPLCLSPLLSLPFPPPISFSHSLYIISVQGVPQPVERAQRGAHPRSCQELIVKWRRHASLHYNGIQSWIPVGKQASSRQCMPPPGSLLNSYKLGHQKLCPQRSCTVRKGRHNKLSNHMYLPGHQVIPWRNMLQGMRKGKGTKGGLQY